MSKRDAALSWAARGFRVFPIKANAKFPPLVEPFYEKATDDPAEITRLWSDIYGNELDHNIGVSTTGLVVVDLDTKPGKNGLEAYQKIGANFDTLIVQTPSGGFHCYYQGGDFANTQGDRGGLAPGIDTRGRHGYVLAPGSTIDGRSYLLIRDQAVAPLTGAVRDRLVRIETERRSRRTAAIDIAPGSAEAFAIQYLTDRAPVAVEGQGGDQTTFTVCCFVRDFGVDPATALDLLLEHWNERCDPPWEPGELGKKIDNAFRYGQNQGAVRHPAQQFGGAVSIPPPEYEDRTPEALQISKETWGNLLPQTALGLRPWIYRRLLLRRDVTTLIASGGIGKTQASIMIAILLALGRDFLLFENALGAPAKSMIYDAEETMQELSMRVHAQCLALDVDPAAVAPWIRLVSGREGSAQGLKIATGGKGSRAVVPHKETCEALIAATKADDVALLILNPLIAVHEAEENDNNAMRAVLGVCETIAALADIGVLVAHHTPKADDSSGRGASSVRDAARVSITLRGPTDDDRAAYGLQPGEVVSYLRVDDAKANKSLISTKPVWLKREGIRLLSGEIVGALKPADLHSRADDLRRKMCTVIATGMRGVATGGISIDTAAELLKHGWPLLDTDDKRTIKARIERALREPCLLDDGTTVMIKVMEGGRKVCLE